AKSGVWDVVLTAFNFRQSHREEVRAAIHEAAGAGLGIIAMKTQAGVYWDSRRRQKINMKAALRWVLRDEHVHSSVPAFSNYGELEDDLAVARDPALRPDEERDLRLGEQAGLPGLYCQQCAACVPQCPVRAEVPLLMRAHMYAAGHGRPAYARHVLRGWAADDVPCTRCGACAVRCALGFDVRERALALAQVLDTGSKAM
ncbi:MAG: 4Fe-4S dicluster domain-containing protein, partial [Candidatus Aminicenantes bacterium]|nr:4Fe-4S dicluster domain-containing protein [Candidatus Aminicenantes bacterium]